jgi:hypothetical protein
MALPAASASVVAHTPLWRLSSYPGAVFSRNWSGYALASNAGYSNVHASWVQPAATCDSGEASEASFWIGMGGVMAPFVEQIGTESQCSKGTAVYTTWVELFPNPVQRLNVPVQPGDTVDADITFKDGTYTLSLSTPSGSYTTSYSGPGDNTSAEWIAEAPSRCTPGTCQPLPLTNFGSITFTGATAAPSTGATLQIVMVTNSATPQAVPGQFSDNSFTVTWLRK